MIPTVYHFGSELRPEGDRYSFPVNVDEVVTNDRDKRNGQQFDCVYSTIAVCDPTPTTIFTYIYIYIMIGTRRRRSIRSLMVSLLVIMTLNSPWCLAFHPSLPAPPVLLSSRLRSEGLLPPHWTLATLSMSSSSPSDSPSSFSNSRLFGNQRDPTVDEIQVMDEMISKLADAKPYDLPLVVQRAYRVISSPRFFVRIAELADRCPEGSDEKLKLVALADNLVSTLDAVVSTAQDKMQEYTQDVERVIKAAAEPESGEFLVPLSNERLKAMRQAMSAVDTVSLDGDAFLSTIDAYMNKSHKDGLDLMVVILQNVLQLYAGRRILEARQKVAAVGTTTTSTTGSTVAAGELFNELLQTDSDRWDSTILNGLISRASVFATENDVGTEPVTPTMLGDELIVEIQRNMESIILTLESGSMSQRVQAEYLQELVKRIEHVKQTL